jgi:hypothetical protein
MAAGSTWRSRSLPFCPPNASTGASPTGRLYRAGDGPERIRFSSAILPPYARRSKSLEVLIPILYLKGVSTGDFEEALAALLGKDTDGLSASTIGRLKDAWWDEHGRTLAANAAGSTRPPMC